MFWVVDFTSRAHHYYSFKKAKHGAKLWPYHASKHILFFILKTSQFSVNKYSFSLKHSISEQAKIHNKNAKWGTKTWWHMGMYNSTLTPRSKQKAIHMDFQLWNPAEIGFACQILSWSTTDCSQSTSLHLENKGYFSSLNEEECQLLNIHGPLLARGFTWQPGLGFIHAFTALSGWNWLPISKVHAVSDYLMHRSSLLAELHLEWNKNGR